MTINAVFFRMFAVFLEGVDVPALDAVVFGVSP